MTDRRIRQETKRWLEYAQQDLKAAQALTNQSESFAQQICFLSQQAAEKALKSALIFLQIEFPFRHDLDMLRNLLPQDWQTPFNHPDLTRLTEWAVEARYPSLTVDPTHEDAAMAVAQASAVVESVQRDLQQHGFS